MKTAPVVSVVVPTYRRNVLLRRCLSALRAQRFAGPYEILVADDAGDPSLEAELEALGARYVAVRGAHGPAAARNAGWRAARSGVIAFTDDDCLPATDWLASGLRSMLDGSDAVYGRIRMPIPKVPTDYEKNSAGLENAGFVTANCFVKREALERIGGFDERFRRAWREDSDLYFSLVRRGFRVKRAPEALVIHPVRPGRWGESLRQQRNNLYDALLYKKHPGLYRRVVTPRVPWLYYGILLSAAGAIGAAAAGAIQSAAAGAAAWALLTGVFCRRRLRGTSRAPSHVAEMVVTSALIPFSAVYWRLAGAMRYRVPFL